MACPPPSKPVITVSATHEASEAATAASAALPPACKISTPPPTVAGCPAAIEAVPREREPLAAPLSVDDLEFALGDRSGEERGIDDILARERVEGGHCHAQATVL